MKIITAQQIKEVDAATILAEPIRSVDLMERAAMACVKRLVKLVSPNDKIIVLCGKGNNGGDGLAIARLLIDHGFKCTSLIVNHSPAFSPDAQINHERLTEKYPSKVLTIENTSTIVEQTNGYEICIDALLGTGLNKAAEGLLAEVIEIINSRFKKIISIDVPSGLFCDGSSVNSKSIVRSTLTLSFQLPKLAFLLPQNAAFVPEFEILDIKLDAKKLSETPTKNYYITKSLVASLFKPRNKFSHKGTYGHALLLAGSKGKEGAAVISAKAAMRSGAGLLTVHSNQQTLLTLLCHLPESMTETDSHPDFISEIIKPRKL